LREPGLERLLGAALDHVEQPGGTGAITDGGEIDDHGDELVAAAGVAPHVLVYPDRGDTVEAVLVVDQHPLAFGQDSVVGSVPRDPESLGDPGHGQVLAHDRLECPPQPATRQLRSRLSREAGVLTPHVTASGTPVAAHGHHERRRPPAQRLVGQLPGHRVARYAFATTATAPLVRLDDPARQHRTVGLDSLAGDGQAELIEPAEPGQVRAGEGSVRQLEVCQSGRPRLPSRESGAETQPEARSRVIAAVDFFA
jgi:hypothetical protein